MKKNTIPDNTYRPETARQDAAVCPACGHTGPSVFYEARNVPAHSVLLLSTKERAMSYPQGDITLGFCDRCGFITNTSFDPKLHEYSPRYEETQEFSETFEQFHEEVARHLIEKFALHNKTVIDIGCGKGRFLTMLCEMGPNTGIGFDPAYIPERNQSPAKDRITFIEDFYSEKYSQYTGDLVCCKMTLEHIQDTASFMRTVRRSIGDNASTIVFFQVPNVTRILRELAFWDIYYEHCSYFSRGSLARLFRMTGFEVLDLYTVYNDQYLMIEARPGNGDPGNPLPQEDDVPAIRKDVTYFRENIPGKLEGWRTTVDTIHKAGKKAVIWGGGSKGVTFFTELNIVEEIPYAVDVNPYKKGSFMPGTGQEIVLPEFLRTYKPDVVIAMNPNYREEIQRDLDSLGVSAQLLTL